MGGKSSKNNEKNDIIITTDGINPYLSKDRKCTDILCFLFFILFWIGMFIIAGIAYANGQPQKLIYGIDWNGRTCGAKTDSYDLTDYKYLIYPRLTTDLYQLQLSNQLDITDINILKKLFGVCVKSCPSTMDLNGNSLYIHAYNNNINNIEPINNISKSNNLTIENTNAGSPWKIELNTTNVMYRCLDLGQVEIKSYVRCIDSCENNTITNCGKNLTTNPFLSCGAQGCLSYINKNIPKCKITEMKDETFKTTAARSNPIYDQLNSSWQLISRWLGDLQKSVVPIIICGGFIAIIFGFIWLFLLKYCAAAFVWLTISLVVIMFGITTIYLCYKGDLINPTMITSAFTAAGLNSGISKDFNSAINEAGFQRDEDKKKYWAISAYLFMGMDLLIVLLLIFMISRIRIAIGIIREASKAIQIMPMLLLFPIFPTIGMILLVLYWLITTAYIATCGEITTQDITNTYLNNTNISNSTVSSFKIKNYSENDLMNYLLIYHLFGFLWTNQFLQAIGYTTVAGAICDYYWTMNKSSIQKMPILRSFGRTIRYHLGTLAFGSLIIAIVQMIRLILEYIDHKTKELQGKNKIIKIVLCCCKCFLWCFEQCLKFLNKNAYIIVAMKGKSFCPSMKEAFSLLILNAARVATVGVISFFLLFLGKLFIVVVSCICMFFFIYNPPNIPTLFMGGLDEISSPIFPLIITAILSFAIATFFLGIYETAIDTILLCFCEDCKVNKESGAYYMSDELLTYVDGTAKKNAFRHFKKGKKDINIQENQS